MASVVAARRACGALLISACLIARAANAALCGGSFACQCGDTVASDYELAADLGPCVGDGLWLESGVTLDCRGFGVRGSGDGAPTYGIYLRGVGGVVVRNCIVSGFERGIRLRDTTGSSILDNTARLNGDFFASIGYGIDLASGAVGNLVTGNVVSENADEGIHLGSGSADNDLVENVVWGNTREQIYLLGVTGTRLLGNLTGAPGSNSLYLKDSTANYLEGNRFADRVAVVTGDARDNTFIANDFVGGGLQFRVYEATPNRTPSGNVVMGGSITDATTCLSFRRTSGNTVADVTLGGCGTDVLSEGLATEPSANTAIGVALEPARVSVDAYSTLEVGWWFTERVLNQDGTPLTGAAIRAEDAEGAVTFEAVSDDTGAIPPQILLEYVRTGAGTTPKTPHTVVTTRDGYQVDTRAVTVSENTALEVALAPATSSTTTTTSTTTTSTRPRKRPRRK